MNDDKNRPFLLPELFRKRTHGTGVQGKKSEQDSVENHSKQPRTVKQQRGDQAERKACEHLQQQGLELVDKNYRIPAGEVDLIFRERKGPIETLVFVEVRFRKNRDFGGAAESITPRKQQRIIKAALHYQQKTAPHSSMRFDVVAIEGDNQLNWIKSAFDGF